MASFLTEVFAPVFTILVILPVRLHILLLAITQQLRSRHTDVGTRETDMFFMSLFQCLFFFSA